MNTLIPTPHTIKFNNTHNNAGESFMPSLTIPTITPVSCNSCTLCDNRKYLKVRIVYSAIYLRDSSDKTLLIPIE